MRQWIAARRSVLASAVGVLVIILAIGISNTRAAEPVEYTWTLAALGQGGWIGGPLFEDGSVGGGGALSVNNGQVVARFLPTTWTEDANEVITVCFDVVQLKPAGAPPSSLCVSGDVTGTPIHMTIFGSEHIFRITENR